MVGLLLIGLALGLSNFAAAIGIGLTGVDARARIRVGLVFGLFEATMPILGLILGRRLASSFGSNGVYIGGGLLIAIGLYTVLQARRNRPDESPVTGRPIAAHRLGRLVVSGVALSIDNLIVGFALGTHHVSVVLAAIIIGVVSVALSLVGLELGQRAGRIVERWSEEIGGVVLALVGLAIMLRLF